MSLTFLILPPELRARIYELCFRGNRLVWKRKLPYRARCVALRFVSRKCYEESCLPFFQVVEMDITQLLDRDYYNINAIIPAEELRNVCLDDETLVTTGLRHTVRSMPRLKSFSIDFGLQYEIPNVQNGSPELPKAMKHFISTFSLRLIGGHGFRAETGRRGIKSLITAWRERQQSFLLRSVVHTALSDGGMLSAVGHFDFGTKKLKVMRRYTWEVITEFILNDLVY